MARVVNFVPSHVQRSAPAMLGVLHECAPPPVRPTVLSIQACVSFKVWLGRWVVPTEVVLTASLR